jgi:hypothetical protein
MTLQLLYSIFPFIWGKFDFLFYYFLSVYLSHEQTLKLSSAILTNWTGILILNYWQCSYRVVGPTTTTTTTTPTTVIPATTTSPAPKTTAVPVAYNGEGSCHSKGRLSLCCLKRTRPLPASRSPFESKVSGKETWIIMVWLCVCLSWW